MQLAACVGPLVLALGIWLIFVRFPAAGAEPPIQLARPVPYTGVVKYRAPRGVRIEGVGTTVGGP